MSTRQNPRNIGSFPNAENARPLTGRLSLLTNPEEVYLFNLSQNGQLSYNSTRNNFTDITLARDINNNGIFDSTEAILELKDATTGTLFSENLLPGNYFLEFKDDGTEFVFGDADSVYIGNLLFNSGGNNNPNPPNPNPGDNLAPISGELSNSDRFYCCNNNEQRFYYDEYNFSSSSLQDLIGQRIKLELQSDDFDPVIMLLNADTRQVIGTAYNPNDSNNAQLEVTIEAGVNYLVSVESASPGATGSYIGSFTIV
ncbi:MAG: hypothetical protein VKN72_26535 [Nostocales cyanobacterium 94392]|nr:hypothetical protein [Nostocales cyanobacterium 94392]